MGEMDLISIIIVVILVIFIIILVNKMFRKRRHQEHHNEVSQSPPNKNYSKDDAEKFESNSNYKVTRGQSSIVGEERNVVQNFPRHEAMASKPKSEIIQTKKNSKNINNNISNQVSNNSQHFETIEVSSVADLFSPKVNYEKEYGVTEDELQELVKDYEKKKEYKERRLPINKNFRLDAQQEAERTIRNSYIPDNTKGSKRGTITASIYKKFGKNFIKQAKTPNGEVNSLVDTDKYVAEARAVLASKTNNAVLISRV